MTNKGDERTRKVKILSIPAGFLEDKRMGANGEFTFFKKGIKVEVLSGQKDEYMNIQETESDKATNLCLPLVIGNVYQVMEKCTGAKEGKTYWKVLSHCKIDSVTQSPHDTTTTPCIEPKIITEPTYMKPTKIESTVDANQNLHKEVELNGSEAKYEVNGARDGMIFNKAIEWELIEMKQSKRHFNSMSVATKAKELTVSFIEVKKVIKKTLLELE